MTQTSASTEAGPGSAPGQASAYRRALDDQAMTEGPLDLTVPLDIAQIRAALATTGPLRKVGLAAAHAGAPRGASTAPARLKTGHRRIRPVAPRRIGRIFAFVAVTATLSVGTAWALVASTGSQNTSVSLPSTGAIPTAPSPKEPQSGGGAINSGSTTAAAAPSLSHSKAPHPPVAVTHTTSAAGPTTASPTASATGTTSTATATPTGGATATATNPGQTSPAFGAGPTSNWEVLYQGASEDQHAQQETTSVQGLLVQVGFLTSWHHHAFIDPADAGYGGSADPSGYYGSATSDAVAQFQQAYGVQYTIQLGTCDSLTYQTLLQVAAQSQSQTY